MERYDRHSFDVIVIGAGGAGLRAASESSASGARTALVCKSLLGKAHTVMAEGGIAAALAHVDPQDNWETHFRDTMKGGSFLNHWRMAQLHAQEAPDRVRELEHWRALFDRTPDRHILQRAFGGHASDLPSHCQERARHQHTRQLPGGHEHAENDDRGRAWLDASVAGQQTKARRPPELATGDIVARAIYTEVKEGRGSPRGGAFLDISSLPAERGKKKLPSMYHQFLEL